MSFTKIAKEIKDFYHATNKENFEKILSSGKLRSPRRLAESGVISGTISVEPNRWSRERSDVSLDETVEPLRDKVFFSEGGAVRGYGDYVIHKRMKSPVRSGLLNLIPREHTTGRDISVKSNARLIVPHDELDAFRKKFPELSRQLRSSEEETMYPIYSRRHAIPELPAKLISSILSKTASAPTAKFNVKEINPRAMLGGSSAIGIGVDGVQDIDMMIPYKRRSDMVKARERLLAKYPGLKDSPFNTPERKKFVLSGMVDGNDLDVVIAANDPAMKYIESIQTASASLTDDQKAEIRERKAKLKNALFFSDRRYSAFKKKLDRNLNIAKF